MGGKSSHAAGFAMDDAEIAKAKFSVAAPPFLSYQRTRNLLSSIPLSDMSYPAKAWNDGAVRTGGYAGGGGGGGGGDAKHADTLTDEMFDKPHLLYNVRSSDVVHQLLLEARLDVTGYEKWAAANKETGFGDLLSQVRTESIPLIFEFPFRVAQQPKPSASPLPATAATGTAASTADNAPPGGPAVTPLASASATTNTAAAAPSTPDAKSAAGAGESSDVIAAKIRHSANGSPFLENRLSRIITDGGHAERNRYQTRMRQLIDEETCRAMGLFTFEQTEARMRTNRNRSKDAKPPAGDRTVYDHELEMTFRMARAALRDNTLAVGSQLQNGVLDFVTYPKSQYDAGDDAKSPDAERLRVLLAYATPKQLAAGRDQHGNQLLAQAAYFANFHAARALLNLPDAEQQKAVDVNDRNKYGDDALIRLIKFGTRNRLALTDYHFAELLLAKGANFRKPNADGLSALLVAAQFGKLRIVLLLLKHGATMQDSIVPPSDYSFYDDVSTLVEAHKPVREYLGDDILTIVSQYIVKPPPGSKKHDEAESAAAPAVAVPHISEPSASEAAAAAVRALAVAAASAPPQAIAGPHVPFAAPDGATMP